MMEASKREEEGVLKAAVGTGVRSSSAAPL